MLYSFNTGKILTENTTFYLSCMVLYKHLGMIYFFYFNPNKKLSKLKRKSSYLNDCTNPRRTGKYISFSEDFSCVKPVKHIKLYTSRFVNSSTFLFFRFYF